MITGGEILRGVMSQNTKVSRPIAYTTTFDFSPNSQGRVNSGLVEFKENAAFLMTSYIWSGYSRYFTTNCVNIADGVARSCFTMRLRLGPTGKFTSQAPVIARDMGTKLNSNTDLPEYVLFENNESLGVELTQLVSLPQDIRYIITFFGVEYRGNK